MMDVWRKWMTATALINPPAVATSQGSMPSARYLL